MLERLSPDATKTIVFAQNVARRLGYNFIDTEILLLGLIAAGAGKAAIASATLDLSLTSVRKAVESVIGRGSDNVSPEPPFTAAVERVFKRAVKEAGRGQVNSEGVFRALLLEADCDAVHILKSLSVDTDRVADVLKQVSAEAQAAKDEEKSNELLELLEEAPAEVPEDGRVRSREEALARLFGLNNFIKGESVPSEMLGWFDENDTILGIYMNAEDDLLVLGEQGICWYDGAAKTYIQYQSIDSIEEPKDIEDPYLKLVLRSSGKVVMLPVLHTTEDFPDYVDICEYLSFCAKPKVTALATLARFSTQKMDIQNIKSKEDLIDFLRQPSVQSEGFEELASWLQNGPKPAWLQSLKIAPELLSDPGVWRLFALMLARVPKAADKE